jgi:hypothetical protein
LLLLPTDEGDQVADDRRRKHRCEERPAVRVQTEVDDGPIGHGLVDVECVRGVAGIEPLPGL